MRSLSSFAVVPSSCTLDRLAALWMSRAPDVEGSVDLQPLLSGAYEKTIVQDRAEQRNSRRQFSDTGALFSRLRVSASLLTRLGPLRYTLGAGS